MWLEIWYNMHLFHSFACELLLKYLIWVSENVKCQQYNISNKFSLYFVWYVLWYAKINLLLVELPKNIVIDGTCICIVIISPHELI